MRYPQRRSAFELGRDGNGQAGFDSTQRQSAKRQSGMDAAAFAPRRLRRHEKLTPRRHQKLTPPNEGGMTEMLLGKALH
jgi:hypothetical protein